MNSYVTDTILEYSDVILPIASFAETSGTFIGVDGQWQSFTGAVQAKADSRPGWKVLRVLGNLAKVSGFDYVSSQDVRDEVRDQLNLMTPVVKQNYIPEDLVSEADLMAISEVPMYQGDSVVRRSSALQQTPDNQQANIARMNAQEADKQGVTQTDSVTINQGDNNVTMTFEIDNTIADGCIYVATGIPETSQLGAAFSTVQIEKQQGASHD